MGNCTALNDYQVKNLEEQLCHAIRRGNLDSIVAIKEKGVDFASVRDEAGWSLLQLASGLGNYEIVKYLIEEVGIPVDEIGSMGRTALMRASEFGHINIATLLLDNGASVNMTNSVGRTALMIAAESGQMNIVRLLLEYGADVNAETQRRKTALMISCECGHIEQSILLAENGAELDKTDMEGRRAIDIANYPMHRKYYVHLVNFGEELERARERFEQLYYVLK